MSNLITPSGDLLIPSYGESERAQPSPSQPLAVALITLPSNADLPSWLQQCAVYDEQINQVNEGWSSDPDSHLVTLITYPALRGVRGVAFVYVSWRDHIICRHQTADVVPLQLQDLRAMDAVMAAGMKVGEPYLWVEATYQRTPGWLAPTPAMPLRFGRITHYRDGKEPQWL